MENEYYDKPCEICGRITLTNRRAFGVAKYHDMFLKEGENPEYREYLLCASDYRKVNRIREKEKLSVSAAIERVKKYRAKFPLAMQ